MNDVAPELFERVSTRFDYYVSRDEHIKRSRARLEKGTANFEDAYYFAQAVGDCLSDAFSLISEDDLPDGRMYYNIAQKVVEPLLERAAAMCEEYAKGTIKELNEAAGIGLNAI